MRIKRLDLLAFGPFTNKTLDLSEGKPGLHVVHGPNEAGKSSMLRALRAWLFGIDARSTDNFVHDHRQLRVGGVLETSSGSEIACVRRKGNKDTLLSAETEQPIGDDILSNLLPGLDEKLFSQFHGIDHAGLVQGGQAILEQSGDLGKSLFGAALGTKGNADLLGELASEADKLFRSRGQNQIINAAAAKLKEARREEKRESVSVKEWKDLRKSLREAEDAVARIDEEIAEAMGVTVDEFHTLLLRVSGNSLISMDENWFMNDGSDNAPMSIEETLESSDSYNPDVVAEKDEIKKLIARALMDLPEREKQVLILYYYEGLTLKEIGSILAVTESRVSQLHTKAIMRLRGKLEKIKEGFIQK